MTRIRSILVPAAAIVALIAVPVLAQTVPAPSPAPGGAPGLGAPPAPRTPSLPQEKQVEGPVKKVDPAAKTLQVGWFLGLFTTTLEVTDDTQIAVDGMKASLSDIREGARAKAAYEARDGKNIAKSIDVMPAEQKETATSGAPAPAPPIGASSAAPAGRSGN
jgi:hypothetical protein